MPKIVEWKTVYCHVCFVGIQKRVTDIARNRTGRFFCSKSCQHSVGIRPRSRSEIPCQQCGTSFYPVADATTFCSMACRNAAQVIYPDKDCEFCGTPYRPRPGQRERFCSRPCWIGASYKRPLDRQHNGKPAVLDNHGYVRIYEPGHPAATKSGWIFEHRHVVEKSLGRTLANAEHVHHLNHVRDDNRLENLQVLSHSEHSTITAAENRDAIKAALEARQRLAEYEALYGPLPIIQGQLA